MKPKDTLRLFIASGFFLGLLPLVPGSFGALAGLAWHGVAWHFRWTPVDVKIWCLTGAVIFSALHYWLTPWAQAHWGESDPKHFVLDEVVGYLAVPVFTVFPDETFVAGGWRWPVWYVIAGFVIFRILDAIKLPGARYIDRNIHNAHGVLFDDIVSAIYTAAILSAFAWCTR